MFGKLKSLFKKSDEQEMSAKDEMNAFLASSLQTWTRTEPLDDDGLARIRNAFETWHRTNPGNNGIVPECTCEKCPDNRTCTLAFDLYNTSDDCLRDK